MIRWLAIWIHINRSVRSSKLIIIFSNFRMPAFYFLIIQIINWFIQWTFLRSFFTLKYSFLFKLLNQLSKSPTLWINRWIHLHILRPFRFLNYTLIFILFIRCFIHYLRYFICIDSSIFPYQSRFLKILTFRRCQKEMFQMLIFKTSVSMLQHLLWRLDLQLWVNFLGINNKFTLLWLFLPTPPNDIDSLNFFTVIWSPLKLIYASINWKCLRIIVQFILKKHSFTFISII